MNWRSSPWDADLRLYGTSLLDAEANGQDGEGELRQPPATLLHPLTTPTAQRPGGAGDASVVRVRGVRSHFVH